MSILGNGLTMANYEGTFRGPDGVKPLNMDELLERRGAERDRILKTLPVTDRVFHDEAFKQYAGKSWYAYWYEDWRARVERTVDGFIEDMQGGATLEEACERNDMTKHDVGMCVRFGVFTDEEVKDWGLRKVERAILG